MTRGTCFLMSSQQLNLFDPVGSSSRMSGGISLSDSEMSSVRFTTWGMTRDGEWFALPMPEHLTVARESSSSQGLPTPHAGLGERGRDGVYPNPKGQQDLQHTLAHLLPTPTVVDMGNNKTPEQWEEWKATQKAKHKNGNGHGASLTQEAISLLPTPKATNNENQQNLTNYGPNLGMVLMPDQYDWSAKNKL